jgi:hypothetical protein
VTHRLARASSSPASPEPTVSARTWRRVRRGVSIGIFGAATTAAVVVGSQGAATSPVAPAAATAAAAPAARIDATGPVAGPPGGTVDPAGRGHGHRRR